MTNEELLTQYSHEREVLVRLLRRHKVLTDSKFDSVFSTWKRTYKEMDGRTVCIPRLRSMKVDFVSENSVIGWGGMFQDQLWAKYLTILHAMVSVGEVKKTEADGHVEYSL